MDLEEKAIVETSFVTGHLESIVNHDREKRDRGEMTNVLSLSYRPAAELGCAMSCADLQE